MAQAPTTSFPSYGMKPPVTFVDTTTDATDILKPDNSPAPSGGVFNPSGTGGPSFGAFTSIINYLQNQNKPSSGSTDFQGNPVSPTMPSNVKWPTNYRPPTSSVPPVLPPLLPQSRPTYDGQGNPVSPVGSGPSGETPMQQQAIPCYGPCDSSKAGEIVLMSITGSCPLNTLPYPPSCKDDEAAGRIQELLDLIEQQQDALNEALASGTDSSSEAQELKAQIAQLQADLALAQSYASMPPAFGMEPPAPKKAGLGNMGMYVVGGGLALVAVILLVTRRAPAPIAASK